jgi:hypothetical protein
MGKQEAPNICSATGLVESVEDSAVREAESWQVSGSAFGKMIAPYVEKAIGTPEAIRTENVRLSHAALTDAEIAQDCERGKSLLSAIGVEGSALDRMLDSCKANVAYKAEDMGEMAGGFYGRVLGDSLGAARGIGKVISRCVFRK